MPQATTTTEPLNDAQRTFLAVGLARQHELPIVTAVEYAQTFARLLEQLPPDRVRHCGNCGAPVGPLEHWCSRACFYADEGRDHGDRD